MHSSLEDKRCQECLRMSFLKCWQRDPQGMKRFGSFKAMSLKGLNQDSNIKHSHSFIFFYSLALVCVQFQSIGWHLKTIKDLWLEFLPPNGSHRTAYWLALWAFLKNRRKALMCPNNRTEPIARCVSDCCRKHPLDNVCDKQKRKPLLSDDLPGSVCVCVRQCEWK